MRRPLAVLAIAGVVFGASVPVEATRDGEVGAETKTEASADSGGVSAGLDVWIDEGAVSLGPDPFVGCDTFANVDGRELASLTATDSVDGERGDIAIGADGEPVLYALIRCDARLVRFWQQTDPVPAEVIDLLVRSARSRVPIVTPEPSLVPDGVDAPFLAQLPVWMWIPEEAWVPATATASLPELGLAVSVTASPTSTTWSPGDGSEPFDCGPGVAWQPGMSDVDSDCTHAYTATAGVGDVEPLVLQATVRYEVGVTCVPASLCVDAPTGLGPMTISSQRSVSVTEVKGLLSRRSGRP